MLDADCPSDRLLTGARRGKTGDEPGPVRLEPAALAGCPTLDEQGPRRRGSRTRTRASCQRESVNGARETPPASSRR